METTQSVAINALLDADLPELLLRLGRDHARIAQINAQLANVSDQLAEVESGELDDGVDIQALWDEAADCLLFLKHFADRAHHPLEDRLFDAVLHKGLTPTERHLVFRNLGQHQEIMTLTDSLMGCIHGAQNRTVIDMPVVTELAAEYLALQRRHMTFEEMHLFPLLMSRLDNDDWNRLNTELNQQFPTTELER
jgi:hemerythrin-like domain-containing protein